MQTLINTKRIWIFLAITFAYTWTTTLALRLTVARSDIQKAVLLANLIGTIFTPALASLITRLITKEGWKNMLLRPKFRRGWKSYLAAWLLPFLAITVSAALYYLAFPQSFDSNLTVIRSQLTLLLPSLADWVAGASSGQALLVFSLYLTLVLMPVYSLLEIGEELGWRGYLLPKLVELYTKKSAGDPAPTASQYAAGVRKASLMIGLIWWLWHVPGRYMFDPGWKITVELISLVPLCAVSLLLSWVTLRSGSVWPAAVGHASHNNYLAFPISTHQGQPNLLLGPASGLIGSLGYAIVGLALYFSRKAFTPQGEAQAESLPAAREPQAAGV